MKLALFSVALALPLVARGLAVTDTNICDLEYSYCPRDPGCKTYTMSVHSVTVHDDNSTAAIKVKDIAFGSELSVTVAGNTTLTSTPNSGSYRVYSLQGKNVGAGPLSDVLTVSSDGTFELSFSFVATADVFDATKSQFEFGIDVFQSKSGSDEGMCVQVANTAYMKALAAKSSPAFDFLCKDDGDGHFEPLATAVPMPVEVIPAPACAPTPSKCALDWYYCPRDPGCVTYTMSVDHVEFDTQDKAGYKAGDNVTLHLNGTTSLKSIPVAGSYRIYSLAGKNAGGGVLADDFKMTGVDTFEGTVPITLTTDMFVGEFFELGLDVFQAKSGSDEGMCIEIANPAYVASEQAKQQPAFNADCIDKGGGHFASKLPDGVPETVNTVQCITS